MRAAALLCALATGALACARPLAPPGGERDVAAPGLVATVPEPLAVVGAGNTAVVFRFNERISERGFSEALLLVSPLDSALRVDRSGTEVRVRIDGGWRPNRVYRVVLLPGLRDLFGNERREPVELIFSTGAPVGSTALAGMVMDRLTGEPAPQGVVDAVHRAEGARYTAVADSSGFYSLRYLPLGEYDVRAYDDQNRNRRRDLMEPVDSGYTALFAETTDTVALLFDVLAPDTTAPRIARVRALDSLHVHIEMDDYFDPGAGLDAIRAEVNVLPDSTRYAAAVRIMPEPVFTAERRAAEAARAAADTTAAGDTAAVARDTIAAPPDTLDARPDTAAGLGVDPELPIREVVVRLDRPLIPGTYTITVLGVVNLHGLSGGGTEAFEMSAPPAREPPPPPPDTTRTHGRF
jgi:hypothetical protein